MSLLQQVGQIVRDDIEPEFLKSFCISMGWMYSDLYEELAAERGVVGDAICLEEFARRRGGCANRVLAKAAHRNGVPYEFRHLSCNGQHKLLVKAGRVILIQEPILTLQDDPHTSEYKRELADSHGLIRQLELDLGDRPRRHDWSGCVLGVMLHGAAGPHFTTEHRALGALMLAVPDAAYKSWVLRLDLRSMAEHGHGFEPEETATGAATHQQDEVHVTLKRRNALRESGK